VNHKDVAHWYVRLAKPSWAPPAWVFGPVWTLLYIIIVITYGMVFYGYFVEEIPLSVMIPFALNLFFNLIFSPIQFRLRSNYLAMIDIFFVLGSLFWALIAIYPYMIYVAYANVPYLCWVMFATFLQVTITRMNRFC
jgi:translocator protein